MTKRVLITGASGFIGSNVLQYLLNNTDWQFTAIASFRHHGNPFNIPISDRVQVLTMDLTAPIPAIGTFDYYLHLASESHVDRSIVQPVEFIENNVKSTLNVLEYARKTGCERFIMFSTDEVYGAHAHEDWDVLLPTNPYAASKAAQEVIAISYFNSYKMPITITNTNNVVGQNQDPEKFVPKIAQLIKANKTVELHTHKGKFGSRHYNPVTNVASALQFIIESVPYKADGKTQPQRFSLTGGKNLDNLQMAQFVANILGKKLKYKEVDVSAVRPAYDEFYADGDNKLGKFGWRPPVDLERGLQWIKYL